MGRINLLLPLKPEAAHAHHNRLRVVFTVIYQMSGTDLCDVAKIYCALIYVNSSSRTSCHMIK
jgi:hypothetical protein